MKKGTRIRLKSTGEIFTYAGIDGSCAQMMRDNEPVPYPIRLWGVHEVFDYEDGTPIEDRWYEMRYK